MPGQQVSAVKPRLILLQQGFTLHRFGADTRIPMPVLSLQFTFIIRSRDELSILVPDSVVLDSTRMETGWRGIMVDGPLEFEEIGVLAGLSLALAEAGIAILAMSSFETDYLFVKSEQLDRGITALAQAGYTCSTADTGETGQGV
jgi:hypothetical protein